MESLAGKHILVTGATGRQGGSVARHLLSKGFKVSALTRHPDHAEAHLLARKGARILEGDMDDPSSLPKALEGIQGLFAVQNVAEHGFEGEIREGRNIIDAASASGVRHIVYSSLASADFDDELPMAPSKRAVEDYLRNCGIAWTILRPVFFMENFYLNREEILEGKLRMAIPHDRKLQMIASDDIGEFAALAFEKPKEWAFKSLDLAGSEMTMPQVAQIFSEALDKEVTFDEIDLASLAASNPGLVPMYRWFSEKGFQVDLPALRARFPWIKTFGEWVQSTHLNPADAQDSHWHRPISHAESPVKS